MQPPALNTFLLLALIAPLLASPLPRRDITVRYRGNYPSPPAPRSPSPIEEEVTPSPTSDDDIESILSVQKPLPSIFLMNLSKLRDNAGDEAALDVDVKGQPGEEEEEIVKEKMAEPTESARSSPEARHVNEGRSIFVSEASHLCPFAGLVVFWTLGFLACAIQRYVS